MPNVQQLLEERVTAAMRAAFPDAADAPALVLPAQDPRFGDYQANGAMGLAKRLGKKPHDVAAEIVARLDVSGLAEAPQVAGPGFINFRLKADWVGRELGRINPDERLGCPQVERPETIVVDYSAPNLAKEMHVGHLRSTIIGDALVRLLEFTGHKVTRQNHVGDWGTQFGMLLAFVKRQGLIQDYGSDWPQAFFAATALDDLEEVYRQAKQLFDEDAAFAQEARETVVKLHQGDPDTRKIWDNLLLLSMGHCKRVYEKLGALLTDDDICGESAYNNILPHIVKTLREESLLTESEGDEGYLYATTDLAAIAFRTGYFPELPDGSKSPRADRILYVVDARQSLHFQMVFAVARKADFAPPDVALEHIAFGMMLGPDNRPFKTREGGTVKLMDLLDEAEERALALVNEKNPDLPEDEKKEIARIVGIGAVKYGDLAQNRSSDYRFDWDQMLSLQGNTAPYMQYAYARVRSIFRKACPESRRAGTERGGHEAEVPARRDRDDSALHLEASEELALAKMLLRFPETLDRTLEDYRPNILAAYLFDLAQTFTSFYEACPVLKSPEPVRADRLKLCDLTARTIRCGLGLLGIETADRM